MKYFLWVLRIVIGVLFIFSGVVKANDPMGLVYKMNEFYEVLHLGFMEPLSFTIAIVMIAFEIVSGVAVLLGFAFRFFSLLLLLLNLFFTFLTAFALFSGKIKECGCFGACIKISPAATFYKDVLLLIISVILFAYRNRVTDLLPRKINAALIALATVFAFGIQWYSLVHLPINDCLAYGPGNNILQKMQPGPDYKPAVIKSVFIYQKDGKPQEFTQENYPWKDTTWKFVDRKDKVISEAVGEPEIHDFILTDSDNNDQTKNILTAKGYAFFWFIREPDKAHTNDMDRVAALAAKAEALHIPFYALCSSDRETMLPYMQKWNLAKVQILTLDHTASKTAMRTNPGLMLIHDGTVVQKWSYKDYPKDMTLQNDKLDLAK
jgi:uncharacterized membrane protein YphA (DoxX/SURF4 family)